MPVTPSNRYRGTARNLTWAKTFPATAAAITMTGIHSFKIDDGISIKKEAADGDLYPTACFNDFLDPSFTFDTIDPEMSAALTPDMRGTTTLSLSDAANGLTTGGGGFTLAITNTYEMSRSRDFAFREFGKGSMAFGTISADGTTSPITKTAL